MTEGELNDILADMNFDFGELQDLAAQESLAMVGGVSDFNNQL
jgi:hypothetical protein